MGASFPATRHRVFLAVLLTLVATGCTAPADVPIVGFGFGNRIDSVVTVVVDRLREEPLPFEVIWDVPAPGTWTATTGASVDQALELVAKPGLVAVIGHEDSRSTLSAAPIYQDQGIPLLSPLATSDALGDLGEGVFRLVPGNREQGRILAGWALRTMRATTGIIYYVTDEYGASLRDGIHEAFIEGGGEILDGVPILEAMDLDLEGLVRQSLSRGTPDVVFLAVRADAAALLIEEIERFGVEPIYLTGDGASNEEVIRSRVRPAAWERFHRARFWHPDASASGDFPARWERIFGRAPTDAQVVELDAAWTLVEAMREVGPQPGAIREFLTSLGRDRPTLTGTAGPIEFTRGFSGGFVLVRSSRDSVVARMWDRDNP